MTAPKPKNTAERILAELASGPKSAAEVSKTLQCKTELAGALVRLENDGKAFHCDGRWHVPTLREATRVGAMLSAVGDE